MPDQNENDAAKPKSFLRADVEGEDKGCWLAMAQIEGIPFVAWVIKTLNAAVPDKVRAEVRRRWEQKQKTRPGGSGTERKQEL